MLRDKYLKDLVSKVSKETKMLESLNISISPKLCTSLLRNSQRSNQCKRSPLKQFQRSHCDTNAFAVMAMEIMHHRMVWIQVSVQLMDLKPLSDVSNTLVLQLCKSIHKHDISKITDRKQLIDFVYLLVKPSCRFKQQYNHSTLLN